MLLNDQGLIGLPNLVNPGPSKLFLSIIFPKSLVIYPSSSGSYSAIVHWIGCINAIKLQI